MSLERRSFLKALSGPAASPGPSPAGAVERGLVLRFVNECLGRGCLEAIPQLFDAAYRWHGAGRTLDFDAWRERLRQERAGAGGFRFTLQALHTWRGGAAWRWRLESDGTALHGINIESIREGRFVETWSCVQPQAVESI